MTSAEAHRMAGAARLQVKLAHSEAEVRESQRLRYRVFAEEMGAQVQVCEPGLEADAYDRHCQHLVVRDLRGDRVVSSTRILTRPVARRAGGFYSEGEFELGGILRLPGSFMEIGRTCVDPDYRSGAAIGMLWAGLAQFIELNRIDYLIGCASISMADGGAGLRAMMAPLRERHMSPEHLRAIPHRPVPGLEGGAGAAPEATGAPPLPPLLKAYLRVGAWVCGEPCWDPDFGVADLFILLDVENLQERYVRHFLNRSDPVQRPSYALAS